MGMLAAMASLRCWISCVYKKQILGTIKLEGSYLKAADVSRNGTVDVLDLLRIQKHILGSSTITQK